MELNHDCVRDILFWVEKNVSLRPIRTDTVINSLDSNWTDEELIYCIIQLNEAELLDGGASMSNGGIAINEIRKITWKGHEYLDNIRDDTIWLKTKKTVFSKVGSASLSIVSSVAAKILSNELGL
ncbi:DUF2513 domain-containing protein [Lentilactobacillus hilgardii]|uniref:DUF2513 domain-containing protein n=1 Tax=Lentilactobacillus hilgardii TaxID=1588 RepID=UPI0021C27548|nr:DUF2513 domain-containing protein [Lentilactobacillus hilgardii]MCP9333419.1 DUF2513 domain-containing protein [Lentilactobacillus hilgardii]MCP9350024.1 DUF2513 domain-containing protein [Lentilactobacillus hilgardii]MCP9352576.1 DUF2513 domain-containing protein [Lentilactobacillus hilgardii]